MSRKGTETETESVDCTERREGAKSQAIMVEGGEGGEKASRHVQTAQLFPKFIAQGSKV
jgi:hypothetical protein